jgi:hypothetical protein
LEKDLATLRNDINTFFDDKFVKDPVSPTLRKLLMDFYMLLLERVTPQAQDAVSTSSDWISHCQTDRVEYSFIHHSEGFQFCGPSLKTLSKSDPISLLIADSNYGVKKAYWDQVAWSQEFEDSINFVTIHNRCLDHVKFAWFVCDKQLMDCISACIKYLLNYKVITWVKPHSPVITGPRFRHDAEFIVFAWLGNEADFVKNIDKTYPNRYSTVHSEPRVSHPLKNDEGEIVNPYQKPVNLMLKLINMACEADKSLIVDITCGTGTTAVRSFCMPFCLPSFKLVLNFSHLRLLGCSSQGLPS